MVKNVWIKLENSEHEELTELKKTLKIKSWESMFWKGMNLIRRQAEKQKKL